ncbi:hypothetical protein CW304_22570 [Bacillus sp. UFRGS-B20]|nr:hypothetical protein CW304_22570 [Bacillus sp. UFRGS-B20]
MDSYAAGDILNDTKETTLIAGAFHRCGKCCDKANIIQPDEVSNANGFLLHNEVFQKRKSGTD